MGLDEEMFLEKNHDRLQGFGLDRDPGLKTPEQRKQLKDKLRSACHYLENESVEINGLKIWGSPYSPWISPTYSWGFQYDADDMEKVWKHVPNGMDIIVTHGPAFGHGDRSYTGKLCGCDFLRAEIYRVKPQYHLFGHIHEGERVTANNDTIFLNAATCNLRYKPVQPFVVLYVAPKPSIVDPSLMQEKTDE